ncbi:MAG: leucine-rich repeat domain-containing protein [Clostridia bacterium]|nr:leucine-rich repeat domain-containing protein [Clostridia bacterium]
MNRCAANKNRIIAILLALTFVIALIPHAAHAATEGKCGDGLYWSYSNYVLTIYGKGDMYDYQPRTPQNGPDEMPWRAQISIISRVVVEEGCTGIGTNAFYNFGTVREVFFPKTLKKIGARAFSKCSSLAWIKLPEKLETMGEEAFSYCDSLTKVSIGNNLMKIADKAFFHDTALTSLTIAPGCRNIGVSAFSGCSSLSQVDLSNAAAIEAMAFSDTSISSITIGRNAKYLKTNAFSGCTKLSSVTFDEDADPVEVSNKFLLNTPYYSRLSGGLYTIIGGKVLMCKGTYNDSAVTVPDGVTLISDFCFEGASHLKTVNVPETLKGIGEYAFIDCTVLAEITLPASVNLIGKNALGMYTKDLAQYEEVSSFVITSKGFGAPSEYAEKHNFDYSCAHEFEERDIWQDCTKGGARYSLCKYCGACEGMTLLEPTRHSSYTAEFREATCTENGISVRKCRNCNFESSVTLYSTGHQLVDKWVVAVKPTCGKQGSIVKRCSKCNEVLESLTVEKLKQHTPLPGWTPVVNATCTSPGVERLYCRVCQSAISERATDPTGHDPAETWEVLVPPSEDGEVLGCSVLKCKNCSLALKVNWYSSSPDINGVFDVSRNVSRINDALEGAYSCADIACLDYNFDGALSLKDTLAIKQLAGK